MCEATETHTLTKWGTQTRTVQGKQLFRSFLHIEISYTIICSIYECVSIHIAKRYRKWRKNEWMEERRMCATRERERANTNRQHAHTQSTISIHSTHSWWLFRSFFAHGLTLALAPSHRTTRTFTLQSNKEKSDEVTAYRVCVCFCVCIAYIFMLRKIQCSSSSR